jgi:hypothetical protein
MRHQQAAPNGNGQTPSHLFNWRNFDDRDEGFSLVDVGIALQKQYMFTV